MNPYKRTDHRQAFDLAVNLIQNGETDYREIAKHLDHDINREMRLTIAAKACRLAGIKPPAAPPVRVHIEDIAMPTTDAEAAALAMWIQATPTERLILLVEMRRLGRLLSGQVAPWELDDGEGE